MGRVRRNLCKGGQRKRRPRNMSRQGMPKTFPPNCGLPLVVKQKAL